MTTIAPFGTPLYVMAKPAGSLCNLSCRYCYYLEKGALYGQEPRHEMSDAMLERFVRQYMEARTTPQVLFMWHRTWTSCLTKSRLGDLRPTSCG
jgi:uncharacterized protein